MRRLGMGLVALALVLPVAAQQEDELSAKLAQQVSVVRKLAESGVVDAWFHLALLAQMHADEPLFSHGDGLKYLTIAARTGHPDSLRSLAFELLEGGDIELRPEVATLLAEAAILGQAQAAVDLKMVPKLTAITEAQIVDGFNAALQRLAGSRAVDCDLLPPTSCTEEGSIAPKMKSRDVLYARAMIARGPYRNPAEVHQVFNTVLNEYTAFSGKTAMQDQKELLKEDAEDSDVGRELVFRREDGADAAKAFLNQKLESDFEQHRERIEFVLGLINGHRSADDQLDSDAIRSQMRVHGNE